MDAKDMTKLQDILELNDEQRKQLEDNWDTIGPELRRRLEKKEPPLKVGDTLYGYCNGWFGRDSYEDKRIEAIGVDWCVCRDADGCLHVATVGRDYNERFEICDIQEMLNKPENRIKKDD